MVRTYLAIVLTVILGITGLAAQTTNTQTLRLRGKVLDATQLPMAGSDVKVFQGEKLIAEGKSSEVGEFDIPIPAVGEYRLEIGAPDFLTSQQTVRVAPDLQPLSVTLSVKPPDVIVDVNVDQGEIGVDENSNLNTDVIVGDALLDLPDNEEDLLAYLQELAAARGIVDGEVAIAVDGFENSVLPNRAEIAEIRIVNDSFSAAGGNTGPRIEIITRPGTGAWTGNFGLSFADESLNAKPPLSTASRPKPASQTRNFNVSLRGPIIQNRLTLTANLSNNESEREGSALRAVGPNGPVNEGITSINTTRTFNFRPTLMLGNVHTINGSFNYSRSRGENGGVGGVSLPERASNSHGDNWQLQLSNRSTFSSSFINELRFQSRRSNTNQIPVTGGFAINVLDSFNGGGAPNRSSDVNTDYMMANQVRWQATPTLNLTMSIQADYHKSSNMSQNNYNGTYTFSSLHDYCWATEFVGTQCQITKDIVDAALLEGVQPTFTPISQNGTPGQPIPITGVPSRFTQSTGDPLLKVSQAEFVSFIQGEWRPTQRLQVSFGARYQVQQHFDDYNNIAPTAGIAYQLNTNATWRTVIRVGARMSTSTFSMGTYESLLRANGQTERFNLSIENPSFPDPFAGGGVVLDPVTSNSIRLLAPDYVAPYSFQPSLSWQQGLPKRMSVNVNFQVNRGIRQNRTRNINAPWPGTPLAPEILALLNSTNPNPTLRAEERALGRSIVDQMRPFYPYVGNISLQESVGSSLSKNLSIQFRTQNVPLLWGKVLVGGNINWRLAWADDDGGTPVNVYDLSSEWGRGSAQRHQVSTTLNVQLPRNIRLSLNPSWSSGRPYNITVGRDLNGDSSNNDRPEGLGKNAGTGPSSFGTMTLNFSKGFAIGGTTSTPRPANEYAEPQRGGGGGGGGGGFGGGFGGGGQGGGGQRGGQGARNIQLSIRVSNVFNSTTRNGINGNMSSPLFGQLTGGGSGRSVNLSLTTNLGRLF